MTVERRSAVRRAPAADEPLASLRLRTGRELAVVNVSDSGALVEGVTRLLPGTHVEVHVITREGRTLVRSRVMRAWVFAVSADILEYRAVLAFDARVNTAPTWVATTRHALSSAPTGSHYPNQNYPVSTTVEGAC